jgi:DNA-directed RNA polymerase subunit RPC12/RpoP
MPGETPIARAVRNLEDMGNGRLAFSVRCLRCRHKALLPMGLALRLGTAYPIEGVYRRLKCKRCGARGDYLDISLVGR